MPIERALARVCQEAGARVVRNMRLADMNLDVPVGDERRIEVVANGLPLWHGAQLAIDATIVSPVTGRGEAQAGAAEHPGRALANAAQRKRRTYPELVRARRCRLVVFGMEVGGRWGDEAVSFLCFLAGARVCDAPAQVRLSRASARSRRPCWRSRSQGSAMLQAPRLLCMNSWRTRDGRDPLPSAGALRIERGAGEPGLRAHNLDGPCVQA